MSSDIRDIKAKYMSRDSPGAAILMEDRSRFVEDDDAEEPSPPPARPPPAKGKKQPARKPVRHVEEEETAGGETPAAPPQKSNAKKIGIFVGFLGVAVLLILIFVAAFKPSASPPSPNPPGPVGYWNYPRLPPSVAPVHYRLLITTDMVASSFQGVLDLDLLFSQDTDLVVLHSVGLNVTNVYMTCADTRFKDIMYPWEVVHRENHQYLVMHFNNLKDWIRQGAKAYTIHIEYIGQLNANLNGFYTSSYINKADGSDHELYTTQFEPLDARRAFPCMDEPALKANFTITLIYDNGYDAISNMKIDSSTEAKDLSGNFVRKTKFATTPPMSTYLVCWVISEFASIRKTYLQASGKKVTVSLYTTPDTINQGLYAINATVSALSFYEGFFGIEYPFPKLDVVAIPDFAAGAMENWGIITFRQTALLFDPSDSSAANMQRVAQVIAHELAHQWFGDLVTMSWWSDLWLNEGFASYMEKFAIEAMHPDWDIWSQSILDLRVGSMALDALNNTHAIANNFTDASDISQAFDAITYDKGASLLVMLSKAIGPTDFHSGIQLYLNRHQYGSAKTSDLWAAFAEESKDPVDAMMKCWVEQPGFPYVNVTQQDNDKVVISQARFLLVQPQQQPANSSAPVTPVTPPLWYIPLMVMNRKDLLQGADSSTIQEYVIQGPQQKFFHDWRQGYVLVNYEGYGYYRVNYDTNTQYWQSMVDDLKKQDSPIPPQHRAVMVDDLFAFLQANMVPVQNVMNAISFLNVERDYVVWATALNGIAFVQEKIELSECAGEFNQFMVDLLEPVARYVGWDDAMQNLTTTTATDPSVSHSKDLMRSMVLLKAGVYGVPDVVAAARTIWGYTFQPIPANVSNPTPPYIIPAAYRDFVYRTIIATGGDKEYKWVMQRYLTATVASEATRCLVALTYATKPHLLWNTMVFAMGDQVRSQDTAMIISGVAQNIAGRDLAWDFVRQNIDQLTTRYANGLGAIGDIVQSVTSHFTTPLKLQELQDWSSRRNIPGTSLAIAQAQEAIQININWLANNQDNICNWLDQAVVF